MARLRRVNFSLQFSLRFQINLTTGFLLRWDATADTEGLCYLKNMPYGILIPLRWEATEGQATNKLRFVLVGS